MKGAHEGMKIGEKQITGKKDPLFRDIYQNIVQRMAVTRKTQIDQQIAEIDLHSLFERDSGRRHPGARQHLVRHAVIPDSRKDIIPDFHDLFPAQLMRDDDGALFFKFTVSHGFLWSDLIHPDDVPRLLAELKAVTDCNQAQWLQEYRLKNSSGQFRWFQEQGSLNANGHGSVRIQSVLVDIDHHTQTHDALRESEEHFRILAEQSPNMIFINQRGRVIYTVYVGRLPDALLYLQSCRGVR